MTSSLRLSGSDCTGLCLLSLLALCGGCGDLGYYLQAVDGHAQLLHVSRPIPDLLNDPELPAARKDRLRLVLELRAFAVTELALPDNASYRWLAEPDREAVVSALVATPEFSLQPLRWCYPVAGCASYRGYFSEADARAEAHRLVADGRDVALVEVPAYSTLGWLADPLPGAVAQWPEPLLAGLMFHELAHQRIYVPDDSAFNESLASAVERAGVRRWLRRTGDASALAVWERRLERQRAFSTRLRQTRERLRVLYAGPLAPEALRREKQAELERLRRELQPLAGEEASGQGVREWLRAPLNNARLALDDTYGRWVPVFEGLLCRERGDFPAFFRSVDRLAALPGPQRQEALRSLSGQRPRRSCE
jgi:predicted aminopeptidase